MTLAFQRQNRQQIVDGIVHISAMVGTLSRRDPPQSHQRHHMIDTQRTAVTHTGAQQGDPRLPRALTHYLRIHGRQSPVLTARAKNIRRCTDAGLHAVEIALAPRLCATLGDAHRQIPVESDRHLLLLATVPAAFKLLRGQPLQPEPETHLILMLI